MQKVPHTGRYTTKMNPGRQIIETIRTTEIQREL